MPTPKPRQPMPTLEKDHVLIDGELVEGTVVAAYEKDGMECKVLSLGYDRIVHACRPLGYDWEREREREREK